MHLVFYTADSKFIAPVVSEAYRPDSNTVTAIVSHPFNIQMPEAEYELFSKGQSDLLPSVKEQFEAYLNFCFNKVDNWEEMRDAYNHHRMAVIDGEDPVWYCTPLASVPTVEQVEVVAAPAPIETTQPEPITAQSLGFSVLTYRSTSGSSYTVLL